MTPIRPKKLWCGLLLALFVAAGTVRYWNTRGDDLGSSYLGCRLLAAHETGALYSYDPEEFSEVGSGRAAWEQQAQAGDYHTFFHPYVQTPLWAWSLLPLCEHMSWVWFNRIFVLIALASMAGMIGLVAWAWAPFFLRPLPMALLLVGFSLSQPFGYAMFLTQTHALYLLLVVAGLVLAEREWEASGGALVALAAAVKLTPAALFLYWLVVRRWRAAASLALCSIAMMGLTWALAGTPLLRAYLAGLQRVSHVLLLAENNQSFAAWVMGRFYPHDEIFDFTPFRLPGAVRVGSDLLMLAGTVVGGWMDRSESASRDRGPRLGVGVALVSATIFAPIAWTHYSILLVIPVMLLITEAHRLRGASRVALAAITALAVVLNFRPFAADVWSFSLGTWAVLRGQFYAGVLCLAGLGLAWWAERRVPGHGGGEQTRGLGRPVPDHLSTSAGPTGAESRGGEPA